MAKHYKLSAESITALKAILEDEYKVPFSTEEAESVGLWLVGFYTHLSDMNERIARTKPSQPDKIKPEDPKS